MDFSKYLFRASQSSKLLNGNIGLSTSQKAKLSLLLKRKNGFESKECDEKGKPWKELTENMTLEMNDLLRIQKNTELPKGLQNELRKIYRAEKYNRNFTFTNKYVVKGLLEEEEAITTYQSWIKYTKGKNRFFTKNSERFTNKYFTGEPDIMPYLVDDIMCGVDTKCSWSLDSFPFNSDELNPIYESQNQVYMNLIGAEMWVTAYVLVNASEQLVFNEKQKYYKAYQDAIDNPEHEHYNRLQRELRNVEKMLIFDYDRFMKMNPSHLLEYTREEWLNEGNDIPLEDRVVEKVSYRNDDFIKDLEYRANLSRKYLNDLNKK